MASRVIGVNPLTLAVMNAHAALYQRSGGRIGHRTLGVPSLLLHTTGARSGIARTNCLAYAGDGDSYLVVASNFGGPHYPGWYHNLTAEPSAEIRAGRSRLRVTSRVVFDADPDYDRLWKMVNDNNRNTYRNYQRTTDRRIPVIVLSPV